MKLEAALKDRKLKLVGVDSGEVCFVDRGGNYEFCPIPGWVRRILEIECARSFERGQMDIKQKLNDLMEV